MSRRSRSRGGYDAVVVGGGPNGLSAAITFARAGRSVLLLEAADEIGGACRSAPLLGPGWVNDLGSAIHPIARASPFFAGLDLESHGLQWITPPASVGHPLDDGRAAVAWRDLDRTVEALGRDGSTYRWIVQPLADRLDDLMDLSLRPLLRVPRHPLFAARFGVQAAVPARWYAKGLFRTDEARALFAGHAAHAVLPLDRPLTSSFALMFGATVHTVGWPFPRGGAGALTAALHRCLLALGGEVRTGHPVLSMADIPPADHVVLALTPLQVLRITGDHFPAGYRASLARFRYGPGLFKLDLGLSGPIPWTNPDLHETATVHVGGTVDDVARAERVVAAGHHAREPFLILAQHSRFDPSRAPDGKHTVWVYCHVPNGSTRDMTEAIERRIERFAPGFRDLVEHRHASTTADLEAFDANLVGGDVGGGSHGGLQLLLRPRPQLVPWATPDPSIWIGSASTTPGGGVHGMAGHQAADAALAGSIRPNV